MLTINEIFSTLQLGEVGETLDLATKRYREYCEILKELEDGVAQILAVDLTEVTVLVPFNSFEFSVPKEVLLKGAYAELEEQKLKVHKLQCKLQALARIVGELDDI